MHIPLYGSLVLSASAALLPLQPRADGDKGDLCGIDISDVGDVGPTEDGTAGIGIEFESPFFYWTAKCSAEDTYQAKGKLVNNRKGDTWYLSADTAADSGKLTAEYILNGKKIKVGSGDGKKSAKEVADDLIGWKPWQGSDEDKKINVEGNKCNPWKVDSPQAKEKPEDLEWGPQVTTAMPLEALYSLMDEALKEPDELNILNGVLGPRDMVLVTKDFFQSNPQGIDGSKLSDDVLAFCTLVLSYAKAAKQLAPTQSPKTTMSFMPRTEFNTLFKQVETKLPGDKLFDVFNILACYNHGEGGEFGLDTNLCGGSEAKPTPKGTKFGDLTYKNSQASVNVKAWITSIGKKEGDVDKLTTFDKSIDGSIGGFGNSLEKVYQSDRSVPLIEFRDLNSKATKDFETFASDVDSAIQTLHKKFAKAPTKKRKRATPCPQPSSAPGPANSGTPSGGDTVKPAIPPTQPSCVASPSGAVKDAHEADEKRAVAFFCSKYANNKAAKSPVSVVQTVMAGVVSGGRASREAAFDYVDSKGNQDDVYDITIKSVDNCTPANGNNLAEPVAGSKCEDILFVAWKNCDNKGRGGDIIADCLKYTLHTRF